MIVHEPDLWANKTDFTQVFQEISLIASNDLLQMQDEMRFYKQRTIHAMRNVQEPEPKRSRYPITTRGIFSVIFFDRSYLCQI